MADAFDVIIFLVFGVIVVIAAGIVIDIFTGGDDAAQSVNPDQAATNTVNNTSQPVDPALNQVQDLKNKSWDVKKQEKLNVWNAKKEARLARYNQSGN